MANLLWTVIMVLFVLWLLGVVFSYGGALIHVALVVAVVLVIYNVLTKGKPTI